MPPPPWHLPISTYGWWVYGGGSLMVGIDGGGCLMVGINGGGYLVWVFVIGFVFVFVILKGKIINLKLLYEKS